MTPEELADLLVAQMLKEPEVRARLVCIALYTPIDQPPGFDFKPFWKALEAQERQDR